MESDNLHFFSKISPDFKELLLNSILISCLDVDIFQQWSRSKADRECFIFGVFQEKRPPGSSTLVFQVRKCIIPGDAGRLDSLRSADGSGPLPANMSAHGFSYLGCVREPCRTNAVWDMHCERTLLRSWLTAGWLHIWKKKAEVRTTKTNKISPNCWKLVRVRRHQSPGNGTLFSCLSHDEQTRVTASSTYAASAGVYSQRMRWPSGTLRAVCSLSAFAAVQGNKPQRGPSQIYN